MLGIQGYGIGRIEVHFKYKSAVDRMLVDTSIVVGKGLRSSLRIDRSRVKEIRAFRYPLDLPESYLRNVLGGLGKVVSVKRESMRGFEG